MKQPLALQLFYDGDWQDAPDYTRDAVSITRGRQNEQSEPTPSSIGATLDNRSTDYNPKNPASALFGKIGQNTPARVLLDSEARGIGEAAAWRPDRTIDFNPGVSGDAWVGLTADGILRRLTEGAELPESLMRKFALASAVGPIVENLGDDVDQTVIGVGGDAPWFLDSLAGNVVLKSGAIGDDQVSFADLTIPSGATTLSFRYKVSSEEDFDFFRVRANGTTNLIPAASGDVDWTFATVDVTGLSFVRFEYAKDGSLSEGDDAAYVDGITIGDRLVPVAAQYWPCEDGSGATQFASALPDAPAAIPLGDVRPAAFDGFPGSLPLPEVGSGLGVGIYGEVPATVNTRGNIYFRCCIAMPPAGTIPNGNVITDLYMTGGNVDQFEVVYGTGGTLLLRALNSSGGVIDAAPSALAAGIDGLRIMLYVELRQDGSDVEYLYGVYRLSEDGQHVTGTFDLFDLTGVTAGRCRAVSVGNLEGGAVGHIMVGNAQAFGFNMLQALDAYNGESATDRLLRLCEENGVPLTIIGDSNVTMGPQPRDTLPELWNQIARTDGGMLFDARDSLGLVYRTRESLFNQTPALELDYSTTVDVAPPFHPVYDDSGTRNDVTAKRADGSSARAVQATGPRNVKSPQDDPEGVGKYPPVEIDVNPELPSDLAHLASWYLHLGTVDEIRYPQITVDLVAAPALATAAAAVDIGDKITIDNLPLDISPDMASLIVVGYTETIGSHTRTITFNCAPAVGYEVARYDFDRYESDDTRVNAAKNAVETSWTMRIDSGPFWVTTVGNPTEFTDPARPLLIRVNGEVLKVTAIGSPSGNLQVFTVQRGFNGLAKSHPANSKVRLARRPVYA
jgi:hypothetical protein